MSFVPSCFKEVLLGEQGKIEQIDEGVSIQVTGGIGLVCQPIVGPIAKVSKVDRAIIGQIT